MTASVQPAPQTRPGASFRCATPLLPGDDPTEFAVLLDELTAHFQPGDLTEQRYVREMADAEWRLRRIRLYMFHVIAFRADCLNQHNPNMDPVMHQALAFEDAHRDAGLGLYLRYEAQFERQYQRAQAGLISTRERASRHRAREARAALEACLAAPPPVLPFEPNSRPAQKENGRPDNAGRPNLASQPEGLGVPKQVEREEVTGLDGQASQTIFREPLRSVPLEHSRRSPR